MQSHHSSGIPDAQPIARRSCLGVLAIPLIAFAMPGCDKDDGPPKKATAIASKQKLTPEGNPNPTDDDRCPMCAMRIADHADWAGAIELNNGDTFYTCSVRCTLATAMNSAKFLGVPPDEIKRVRVPHYLEKGKSLDARSALYVIDSDVRGPMGLALLPAASRKEAGVLVKRHQGRILTRDQVTMKVLKDLKKRSKSE